MLQLMFKRAVIIALIAIIMTACATSTAQKEQAESLMNIGLAYLTSERFTDALREFLKAEELVPRDPRVHYYIGIAYFEKGLVDKAVHHMNKAISLKEDYSDVHNFLGNIYLSLNQWDKAIDSFKRALNNVLYETPDKALFNMGRAYYGKGDYQTAIKYYTDAKNKYPGTIPIPVIDHHIGMAYYGVGNFNQAAQSFRRALEQAPSLHESRFWLGYSYLKLNDQNRASEEFKTIVKEAPESELGIEAKKNLDSMMEPLRFKR